MFTKFVARGLFLYIGLVSLVQSWCFRAYFKFLKHVANKFVLNFVLKLFYLC